MPDTDFLFGLVPHQEAIDFIKSKPAVSRQVFDRLLPELKDGSEIPTAAFALLTDPAKFSKTWNISLHRETLKVALSILFP